MSDKALVIVESPTKAKTISKFLGKGFTVKASNGHIRDLPNKAAEIPTKFKKEEWAKLGVNIDNGFEPLYIVPANKKDNLKALKEALKGSETLLLATDEDREGESISWHLVEALSPKVPVKRLVFHEITKDAIQQALDATREIDYNLVRAQETRRIVDRLFGYRVSPLLWKKMAPRLSAGRVQSVAIRLLVDRERERIRFTKASYWSLKGVFAQSGGQDASIEAELTHVGDQRVAAGKDFDPETGVLKSDGKVIALTGPQAESLRERVLADQARVAGVEEKPFTSRPPAPFVTSSLQQEANRKLRYSAQRTMRIAQQLYENGYITYMRTDSTTLSEQALTAARAFIDREFGREYLPDQPRQYTTRVKNAQEAHEAIRPAGESFTPMETVKAQLGDEAFRLYELIWKRTVASQMKDAKGTHISVHIAAAEARFRASGKTIEFPGYLRAYVEGSDDPEADLADQEKILPKVAEGEKLGTTSVDAVEHSTQPPARYTEGSLIRELERRGIGRPSTWASIVQLVLNRDYAFKKGTALVPTFTAIGVVGLLEKHFTNLLDYEFTARLEDDLDAISRGEAENLHYLKQFYYGNGFPGLKTLVEEGEAKIDPRDVCGIPIGTTSDGKEIEVRIGRYGPFLTNGEQRASVPEMQLPDELTADLAAQLLANASREPESLGLHPETGEPIYLKSGPYGPYVQLGGFATPEESSADGKKKKKEKPKMASLLPTMTPETVTHEQAVALLSLPRSLGKNPENGETIVAANGRYGPYVMCGSETRSINLETHSPLDITLDQAVELLKQPKSRGRRAAATPKELKALGAHPVSGVQLKILNGRYGPYVTDGETNASLPKAVNPDELSMDQAVELLEARKGREPKKRGRKKSTG
ncbi:MAG: type I DNA topoisomerase [Bdellovibrionales bacterium]|nr:type I DNA topoisomerase [Bdellovibrionales bacterium]